MKKVFYVSYGGGHANISRFIYKELEKDPQVEQEVLSLTAADKIFDRSNVPYLHLTDFYDLFEEKEDIICLGEKLAVEHHNPKSSVPYEQTVAYMGFGLWDLIQRYGKEEALKMFDKDGRKAFLPILVMRRIFDKIKPDCVVITCEVRMEKAAAAVANERGIPVIRISDSHWVHDLGYKCITCVMNETAKAYAINEYGLEPESIFVTGQPVFEDVLRVTKTDIKKAREGFKINPFQKIVLFIPTGRWDENPIIINYLNELAAKDKDLKFIVKLHPNDNKDYYDLNTENIILLEEYPIAILINMADVVLITNSTAGIEATIAGKPIITIEVEGRVFMPMWDMSRFGVAVKIKSLDLIYNNILECLNPESQLSKNLSEGRKAFNNVENSTKNIVNIIKCAISDDIR